MNDNIIKLFDEETNAYKISKNLQTKSIVGSALNPLLF